MTHIALYWSGLDCSEFTLLLQFYLHSSCTYFLTFQPLLSSLFIHLFSSLFMHFQAMKKGPLGALGLLKGLKMKDLSPEGTYCTYCNVLTVLCCTSCIILYRYLLTYLLFSFFLTFHPSIHPSVRPSFLFSFLLYSYFLLSQLIISLSSCHPELHYRRSHGEPA